MERDAERTAGLEQARKRLEERRRGRFQVSTASTLPDLRQELRPALPLEETSADAHG